MDWMLKPMRRYSDFSGRSRRKEFWMFVLFNYILAAVYGVIVGIAALVLYYGDASEDTMMTVLPILGVPYLLYSLYVFIPGLAVAVRRMHDLDKSGWALLIALVPFVGGIILLVWYCSEGTKGPNRFGPDPLADGSAQVFS